MRQIKNNNRTQFSVNTTQMCHPLSIAHPGQCYISKWFYIHKGMYLHADKHPMWQNYSPATIDLPNRDTDTRARHSARPRCQYCSHVYTGNIIKDPNNVIIKVAEACFQSDNIPSFVSNVAHNFTQGERVSVYVEQ